MNKKNILLLCVIFFLAIFLYFLKKDSANIRPSQTWNAGPDDRTMTASRSDGARAPAGDRNTTSMVPAKEQYRRAAEARPMRWLTEFVAGSGMPGTRDGIGLYAQFLNPQSLSFGRDPYLIFVLDDGAKNIRKIDTRTLQVDTVVSLGDLKVSGVLLRKLSFSRFAVGSDAFYLSDSSGEHLFRIAVEKKSILETRKSFSVPMHIKDLVWDDNRLLVLDQANRQICAWDAEKDKWESVLAFSEGNFDRFLIRGDFVILISMESQECRQINLKEKNDVRFVKLGFVPKGILEDTNNSRYITWTNDHLYALSYPMIDAGEVKSLPFYNIYGESIGEPQNPYEYRRLPFSPIQDMVFAPNEGRIYVIDSPNRRVLKTVLASQSPLYRNVVNPSGFLNPDYSPNKPEGTNRILWMSHSVYWDPSGTHFGDNINLGAVRLFENLLNGNPGITWEILNAQVTGIGNNSFFNNALTMFNNGLSSYGFDYVVLTVDLLSYFWMLDDLVKNPPKMNSEGKPDGIDVEMARKDFNQRIYPKKIQPYIQYVKKHPNEFENSTGAMKPYVFFRLWSSDEKFRNIVLHLYTERVAELMKVCKQNKVSLIAFVAPTINFISINDWEVVGAGGAEKAYNFEDMHRPILEALWKQGVPTYDLSYDVLWRYPKWYPQNGGISHHCSFLFHQAFAESLLAVSNRYGLFADHPLPERGPIGKGRVAVKNNVIYNTEGESCSILHDLSAEMNISAVADLARLTVRDYAGMSLEDIHLHQKRNYALSSKKYSVKFVWVKSRDVYGQPILSNMRTVACLAVQSADLPQVERLQMELSQDLVGTNAPVATKKLATLTDLLQFTTADRD